MASQTYALFSLGNPLLDMQVTGAELLKKYNIKENDAILAEAEHAPIYDDIVKNYKVVYVAGGAAQNAARAAAYVLPPKSVVYTGAVGDDSLADELRKANEKEGVESAYLVKKGEKTGACAVVLSGVHRSLVTTLRAAELFEVSHLSSPTVAPLVDAATHFYIEGFFVTHGMESILYLAKKASAAGKTIVINLSAPFIPQFFKVQLGEVLSYADVVIGNESEAAAWAGAAELSETDLPSIAKAIANLPKTNASRPRIVVLTSGAESTVVATSEADAKVYPVTALGKDQIVDTNGAGDAFAGGFVGALVSGKDIDEAVKVGHSLGAMCVGQVGPTLKWPKEVVMV